MTRRSSKNVIRLTPESTKETQMKNLLQSKLASINGNRRVRTVSYAEAVQAIREALRDGYGHVSGGIVANCYGYPAAQTRVAAMASQQIVVVVVEKAGANKGAGTGLPFRRNTDHARAIRIVAEIVQGPAEKCMSDGTRAIRMTRREASAIVRAQDREDAAAAMARIPADMRESAIPVTASDSLACGNCESETRRVAGWFRGRESVAASELLSAVATRSPSLVSFAIRAIRHAESRMAAV